MPATTAPAPARFGLDAAHEATLGVLEQSRTNAPPVYDVVLGGLAAVADALVADPLTPIDLSTVRGRPYGSYNMDIWRLPGVTGKLLAASLAWTLKGSPSKDAAALSKRVPETFTWVLSHFTEAGTCGAPDENVDRFILPALADAYVVAGPQLDRALADRIAHLLSTATRLQIKDFGGRAYPWKGGYPNMDAAYLLVLAQAYSLTGDDACRLEIDAMVPRLAARLCMNAHEYVDGYNADARYTEVVLNALGRAYQLTGHTGLRDQIAAHAEFYLYEIEPNGQVDFGTCPHIKHDWSLEPFRNARATLELVQRLKPTPALAPLVNRWRAALMTDPATLATSRLLYYLAPDVPTTDTYPQSFFRVAPEIDGFQSRTVRETGVLTCRLTGKRTALDTFVSAIATAPHGHVTAFAGAFLEIVQNGKPYFLTDRHQEVRQERLDGPGGRVSVCGHRHALGPGVRPMVLGEHMSTVAKWTDPCWEGGSKESPPVTATEEWTLTPDGLHGVIRVTADHDVTLDAIRLTLAPALSDLTDAKQSDGAIELRYGILAAVAKVVTGPWTFARVNVPRTTRAFDPAHPLAIPTERNGSDVRAVLIDEGDGGPAGLHLRTGDTYEATIVVRLAE